MVIPEIGEIPSKPREQSNVEFVDEFDYLKPDKPYKLTYMEWLNTVGSIIYKWETNAGSDQTMYTVPADNVLFIHYIYLDSAIYSAGAGNNYIDLSAVKASTHQKILQHTYNLNATTDSKCTALSFPTPYRVDEGWTLELDGFVWTNTKASCGFYGILVPKSLLKE